MAKGFKRQIRMLQAVRLEAQLYKDPEIAKFLGMTPAGLAQLKMDPEYNHLRMQVKSGIVTLAEQELLKDHEYKHEQIRHMVPQALQNLYELARSQNDNIKLKATTEILDREGTMSKVSRIGVQVGDGAGVGTAADAEIAQNLLNILKIQMERQKKDLESTESASKTVQ